VASKRNTLVLAYPNQRWHKDDFQTNWNLNPSTLCLLAAVVDELVDVEIIDAQFYDLSLDEFVDRVQTINPKYIGISVLTTEYKETLHLSVAAIKERLQDVVIIAGGVHVTIEHMDVMSDPAIDYAVIGDGEYVLRDLLGYLEGAGELPSTGLAFRNENQLVVQERAVIADLDSLPMPKYELVRMEDYISIAPRIGPNRPPEMPYARLVVTRGCPVGCSFCQVEEISGGPVRSPSVSKVVDELIFLRDSYGIRSFMIDDDNIVIKKVFFKKLLQEIIDRDVALSFHIHAFAIFKLDDEMLDLMVRAGCRAINVAIESGNQRVMDQVVLKPINLETVPPLIKKVREAGLSVIANFIIGFPGETWAEIRETISFAENCGAEYSKFFVAVPLKGTKMWDMALEMGTMSAPFGAAHLDWRFSQITSNEWTAEDVSILRAYEWDRVNFATAEKRKAVATLWGVTEEEIQQIRKKTRDAVIASIITSGDGDGQNGEHVPSPAERWSDPGSARTGEIPVRIGVTD